MKRSRQAQRAASRRAAKILTLLALLGALVLLVAARAQLTEAPAGERLPAPHAETLLSDAAAEIHTSELELAVTAEPTPSEAPQPYAEISVSEDELYMLACLVWHESRGEPYEGQEAVAEVVLNRCFSPAFPDTVNEVIFQRYPGQGYQFSPASYLYSAQPGETQYAAVRDALDGAELIVPTDTVYFSTLPYNSNIVAVIGNHYFCEI